MSTELLRKLNQRPIAFYPIYRQITGSLDGGILLSQLMYWFSKKDKIYKTDADLQDETNFTTYEIRKAKKQIKTMPFITITREGIPAKTFYEIHWDKYEEHLAASVCTGTTNKPKQERQPNTKTTYKDNKYKEPKGSSSGFATTPRSSLNNRQDKNKITKLRSKSPEQSEKESLVEITGKVKQMIRYWNKQDILPPLNEFRKLRGKQVQTKKFKNVVTLCKLFLNKKIYTNGFTVLPDNKELLDKLDINKLDYSYYGFQEYVDNLVMIISVPQFKQPVKKGKTVSMDTFLGGSDFSGQPSILLSHCILSPRRKQKNLNRQEDIDWIMKRYKERFNPEYSFKANDLKAFDTFLSWAFEYFKKWESGMPQLKNAIGKKDNNTKFYNVIDTYALGAIKEYWKKKLITPGLFRSTILQEKVDKYIRWHGMYN